MKAKGEYLEGKFHESHKPLTTRNHLHLRSESRRFAVTEAAMCHLFDNVQTFALLFVQTAQLLNKLKKNAPILEERN